MRSPLPEAARGAFFHRMSRPDAIGACKRGFSAVLA